MDKKGVDDNVIKMRSGEKQTERERERKMEIFLNGQKVEVDKV